MAIFSAAKSKDLKKRVSGKVSRPVVAGTSSAVSVPERLDCGEDRFVNFAVQFEKKSTRSKDG